MDQPGAALRDGHGRGDIKDFQMTKILFVCTGNICRSAFAEACLKSMLTDGSYVDVSSAGISATVGCGMDPLMAHEAELCGIDPGGHRARQLTGRILKDADIVLAFGPEHVEWIAAECPECLDRVAVLGQVAAVLSTQPGRALLWSGDLLARVQEKRSVIPEDWIEDPYGRGQAAAARAATLIRVGTELLATRIDW